MSDIAIWILAAIPRFVIRALRIPHKHTYIYNGSFDGGLAGTVSEWVCVWCGKREICI